MLKITWGCPFIIPFATMWCRASWRRVEGVAGVWRGRCWRCRTWSSTPPASPAR
jgi:hypothetical protein